MVLRYAALRRKGDGWLEIRLFPSLARAGVGVFSVDEFLSPTIWIKCLFTCREAPDPPGEKIRPVKVSLDGNPASSGS